MHDEQAESDRSRLFLEKGFRTQRNPFHIQGKVPPADDEMKFIPLCGKFGSAMCILVLLTYRLNMTGYFGGTCLPILAGALAIELRSMSRDAFEPGTCHCHAS